MHDKRNLPFPVALCLCKPVVKLTLLDTLALDMEVLGKTWTPYIRAIQAPSMLLAPDGIRVTVLAQKIGKLALAYRALVPTVDHFL